MANQKKNKILLDKSVQTDIDMNNELDRIIKRIKDENEALNNVLKKISASKKSKSIEK